MNPCPRKKIIKGKVKNHSAIKWPLAVLAISFAICMCFGVLSEISLSSAGIAVSIVVILVFVFIAIVADMLSVAITACDMKPFRAMASKKVRGAKDAIKLKKNADRVASIFGDIVGDVCGILSGAAGATVTSAIITNKITGFWGIVIASLVSAVIAAITISGKAFMKRYSMDHAEAIVMRFAKFLSFFHSNKDKQKSKKAKKENSEVQKQIDEPEKAINIGETKIEAQKAETDETIPISSNTTIDETLPRDNNSMQAETEE